MIKKFNIADATGSHAIVGRTPKYVLATDYAALEAENKKIKEASRCFELTAKGCVRALENEKKELAAERDELKRRLDAVVKSLEPGEKPLEPHPNATEWVLQNASVIRKIWMAKDDLHSRAVAIAEGRDNA